MESRMIGNYHVRFGVGEKLEITSKTYLSLSSGVHLVIDKCCKYVGKLAYVNFSKIVLLSSPKKLNC